jgi:hypothetical protein
MNPHAHHFVHSLPSKGASAPIGAARREACK